MSVTEDFEIEYAFKVSRAAGDDWQIVREASGTDPEIVCAD
jgi:hypothetical protein